MEHDWFLMLCSLLDGINVSHIWCFYLVFFSKSIENDENLYQFHEKLP